MRSICLIVLQPSKGFYYHDNKLKKIIVGRVGGVSKMEITSLDLCNNKKVSLLILALIISQILLIQKEAIQSNISKFKYLMDIQFRREKDIFQKQELSYHKKKEKAKL